MPLTLPYLMNANQVHPDTAKSYLEKLKADSKLRIDPSVLQEVESAFSGMATASTTVVLNLDRCGFPTELNPLTCLPGIETLEDLHANGVHSEGSQSLRKEIENLRQTIHSARLSYAKLIDVTFKRESQIHRYGFDVHPIVFLPPPTDDSQIDRLVPMTEGDVQLQADRKSFYDSGKALLASRLFHPERLDPFTRRQTETNLSIAIDSVAALHRDLPGSDVHENRSDAQLRPTLEQLVSEHERFKLSEDFRQSSDRWNESVAWNSVREKAFAYTLSSLDSLRVPIPAHGTSDAAESEMSLAPASTV